MYCITITLNIPYVMTRVYFYNLINPHLHSNTVGMLFLLQKNIYIEKLMYPVYDQGDTSLYVMQFFLVSFLYVPK